MPSTPPPDGRPGGSRTGAGSGRTYYGKRRERGAAAWTPRPATLRLLDAVAAVLRTYVDPITLRQVFYRLVANGVLTKDERAYKRLGDHLVRARRSGRIPWDAIADDSFTEYGPLLHPDGATDFLAWAARQAASDRHLLADWTEDQPVVPLLWVESAGMASSLRSGLSRNAWPVVVATTSGTDSARSKHAAAEAMVERYEKRDQPTVLLHVGDLDEAGLAIFDALVEDLAAFAADLGSPDALAETVRVAVTPEQVDAFGLAARPGKEATVDVIGRHRPPPGGTMAESVQAEALDPADLLAAVEDALLARLDVDRLNASLRLAHEQAAIARAALAPDAE